MIVIINTIISLNSINRLGVVMEKECGSCEVRTEFLNRIKIVK
jgi:hypothetical protein